MVNVNRVRGLRAERRITQWDMALKCGISRDRYWRIENGYAVATEAEAEKLARAFGVSVGDLLVRESA